MRARHSKAGSSPPPQVALGLLAAGMTTLALVLVRNNYLLFHCLAEMFAVAVAGSITMIAWNTRTLRRNDYLLFLGIVLGAVAGMGLVHTISHEGMAVFQEASVDAAPELMLQSRLLLALALLVAPRFTKRPLRRRLVIAATVVVALLMTGTALHTELLLTLEPSTGEPTPLMRLGVGLVILLLLGALGTHWRVREHFNRRVLVALCGAILLAIAAQLCLVFSRHSGDSFGAASHIVELLCFVLLYWALVRLNLSEPYTMLFHELTTNIQSLELEANRDQLTGLHNRRSLMVLGEAQLALAHRLGVQVTVIFADLNGLKALNDEHGHACGDQALQDTAALLRQTFRGADVLARIGGDEFVALLVHGNGTQPVRRLRAALDRFIEEVERPYVLSIAVGATVVSPGQPGSLEDILILADAEMYTDKQLHYASTGGEPRG